eukprot:5314275-Prymnesium_polylepis.1
MALLTSPAHVAAASAIGDARPRAPLRRAGGRGAAAARLRGAAAMLAGNLILRDCDMHSHGCFSILSVVSACRSDVLAMNTMPMLPAFRCASAACTLHATARA